VQSRDLGARRPTLSRRRLSCLARLTDFIAHEVNAGDAQHRMSPTRRLPRRSSLPVTTIERSWYDEGESLGALLGQGPTPPALAHLQVDQQSFNWVPEDDYVGHFAADVERTKAQVMFATQQPLAGSTFGDTMGVPAWKLLPTWYLVARNDEAISPDAERLFAKRMGATTVEVTSSHVAMVSHPEEVLKLIETAAEAVSTTS
jgi:pimeloyl-ACP methyl ester carboxylesterase